MENLEIDKFILQAALETSYITRRDIVEKLILIGRPTSATRIINRLRWLKKRTLLHELHMKGHLVRYRYQITALGKKAAFAEEAEEEEGAYTIRGLEAIQAQVTAWSEKRGTCGGYY